MYTGDPTEESIMGLLDTNSTLTGRMWDDSVQSVWYNYKAKDGAIHQRWYDDPQSLAMKYAAAKEIGLRGVGPFCYSDIVYDTPLHTQQSMAMWDALHSFTQ
jgi:di-N-acetylchitobiase